MSKKSLFILILVVAGLLAYAKYTDLKKGHLKHSVAEKLLTFDLQRVNEAVINNKGKEFRFVQASEGKWICPTSNDYPVKASAINELILKLYDLESSQKLTSNRENYAAFGLDGSKSVITLKDKEGKDLCTLEFGKPREKSRQKTAGESCRYVKSGTLDSVYLISTELEIPEEPSDWFQKVFLNLPKKELLKITFLKAVPEITLLKKEKEEEAFELKDLKPEDTVKPWMINQLSGAFEGLAFSNVLTSKAAEALKLVFSEAALLFTADGLLYRLSLAEQEQKFFMRLQVEIKDLPQEADKAKALQEKTEKMNQDFSKWVYELDSYDAANFTKQYKDFIEEKKDQKSEPNPEELQEAPSEELNSDAIPGITQNLEEGQES